MNSPQFWMNLDANHPTPPPTETAVPAVANVPLPDALNEWTTEPTREAMIPETALNSSVHQSESHPLPPSETQNQGLAARLQREMKNQEVKVPDIQEIKVPVHGHQKRIGGILLELGAITDKQLRQALSESQATKTPLGTVLLKLNFIDEPTLGRALAQLHGLQYIDISQIEPNPQIMRLLPEDFIKRYMVVPIRLDERYKRLEVCMARPDNLRVLDEIALLTGFRPIPNVSTQKELVTFLGKYFRQHISGDEAIRKIEEQLQREDHIYQDSGVSDDLEEEIAAEDAPVVMLVNSMLMDAIEIGASDIHLEPQKARLLVRFRIDGILREVRSVPKEMANAVVSRVKVASNMDIAKRREPQDGRMKIKTAGQEVVDMRVNTLPVQFGEKVVIRILKANATSGRLESLGLTQEESKKIYRMIKNPNGIILVTGPTGSGKTTTLYSCLREINQPEINISTIEDPIEYALSGINQTAINSKAGMTFASVLRALLRQDPDVILVGEVRDKETLEAAIHASLTGHLVFSTIHTNSAAKTITRLLEMGAPPYLVSSAVIGIVAQRLVRRICPKCKESYQATPEDLEILKIKDSESAVQLYKGAGCNYCEQTGYVGRTGLYEIMNMTREIQELVDQGASTFLVEDCAVKDGMYTLAMDGKRKVLSGLTTIEEITRVLGIDI